MASVRLNRCGGTEVRSPIYQRQPCLPWEGRQRLSRSLFNSEFDPQAIAEREGGRGRSDESERITGIARIRDEITRQYRIQTLLVHSAGSMLHL